MLFNLKLLTLVPIRISIIIQQNLKSAFLVPISFISCKGNKNAVFDVITFVHIHIFSD